jgi:RHS repeat-associated protein
MRIVLLSFVFAFLGIQAHAGIEIFSARKSGSTDLVASSTTPLLTLYDSRYNEMYANPSWSSDYTITSLKNTVRLGINPAVAQTNDLSGSVTLEIRSWKWISGAFVMSTETKTLTLSYNHALTTTIATDISSYAFSDAHRVEVLLTSIDASLDKDDIYISTEMEVDRNYAMSNVMIFGLSVDASNTDYYEFNWDQKVGAEGYELEWVHVSSVTMNSDPVLGTGTYLTTSQLNYDYYLNSTRVFVSGNTYRVPKIFDRGYIVYRVRPIGYFAGTAIRNEGTWTNGENGTVATHTPANVITVGSDYDPKMNWSHNVGYDDKGQRFESISYADGLGRGRQQVGHNTVTKQAVVSNVYYDEIGRAVIADLPTPVTGEDMHHKPDFNNFQTDVNSDGIEYLDFDGGTTTACNTVTAPFSNAGGAGKYYSSANTTQTGANTRIPDAELYPYSRAYYMNDFTGRLEKTAGVGSVLRGGNGHDSWFYYPTPNQAELDALFGSEVGQASHYEKMVTVDANGQVYVQYTDMAGRVVMSYLAGDSPTQLSAIDGNGVVTATTDILPQNQQGIDLTVPSATLTYSEYFAATGNYTFDYSFTPAQFQNACMEEGFCLDCEYDLILTVIEECSNVVKYSDTILLAGADVGNLCAADAAETLTSGAIPLTKGGYQIIKKLALHTEIISDNWCAYIDQSTCLTPLAELFTPVYDAEPFEGCVDEIDIEVEDDCASYRAQMLRDLTPGGQYAGYINTSGTYTALSNISTVHSVLTEDNLGSNKDWKNPSTPYVNNDGSTPSPNPTTLSFQQFIENFQDKWAESLLPYHPEYCFLKFCEDSLAASNAYDEAMMNEYTYAGACTAGYFMPLGSAVITPIPCTTTGSDPYFASHPGIKATMAGLMDDYHGSGYSIWKQAVFQAYCGGEGSISVCSDNFERLSSSDQLCYLDLIWVTYRAMYLELKRSLTFQQQNAACSNSQIGLGDWSSNTALFGNAALLNSISTDLDPDISAAEAQTYVDNLMGQACQSTCEEYATDWIEQLAGCEQYAALSTLKKAQLHDEFVDLCMSGCDGEHPMGSTTAPPGYSGTYDNIDEILSDPYFFGSGYEDELCTSLLISEPGPYVSNEDLMAVSIQPLDTCGCNAIEQANYDLTHNNPLGYNLEQMLAHNTGIELEDANYLLCECNKYINSLTYDPKNTTNWITGANGMLIATGFEIPSTLSCTIGSGCVNCETVNSYMHTLETRFEGSDGFPTASTYSTIVTNYLNNELGFHLTYSDYAAYIGKCNASSETPYCTTNPLFTEWAGIMTLLSFRGEILNTSSDPVNLTEDNIVFATGEWQNELNGHEYWSSLEDNTLNTYFGSSSGENCTMILTLPENADFDFSDIVRFGTVNPVTKDCAENRDFTVTVTYLNCGQLQTALLTGSSLCFDANICYCAPTDELLCDQLPGIDPGLCYQPRLDQMYQDALELYQANVSAAYLAYETEYKSDCAAAFTTEALSYTGPRNNYHYTLFYYDQAGNLVQTVAPKGINAFNPVNAPAARNAVVDFSTPLGSYSPAPFPAYDFKTLYQYNSYNQLVSTTNPDQNGNTIYLYDRYGRIVASQNPVQFDDKKYSYILYDKYGRPVETGQIDRDLPSAGTLFDITEATLKADDLGAGFKAWVYAGVRTEVTFTVYDKTMSAAVVSKFETAPKNLRLRVASVLYFDAVTTSTMPLTGYASALHYTYDEHGNVLENLQDVPALEPVHQDVKSTRYEFELLSGNVKKVKYQEKEYNSVTVRWEDGRDRITHEYVYDALNRLTEVFSTTDGGVHKNREAHYRYFDYGPMARTEIGEHKVQANDFSYTINGWLKGMNSSALQTGYDPGRDGMNGQTSGFYNPSNVMQHDNMGRDEVGYTIGYFQNDYKGINTATANFEANPYQVSNAMATAMQQLYNGNISHVVTSINGLTQKTQASIYKYDQLQRLKSMDVYRDGNLAANNYWATASTAVTSEYQSTYSYDQNGNLTNLNRNGTTALGLGMDVFAYSYQAGTNKLTKVTDASSIDGAYSDDINSGQGTDNYQYDKIGQLTKDLQEGIGSGSVGTGTNGLTWRFGDKKLKSEKGASKYVEFIYNPFGQRVVKITKEVVSGSIRNQEDTYSWLYTYYAYDANGQVMATYDVTMNSGASVQRAEVSEQHLYGAGRLGMVQPDKEIYNNGYTMPTDIIKNYLGKKNYELTNYLGNVNAVVTDRKVVTQNTQLSVANTFTGGVESWVGSGGTLTHDAPNFQLKMVQTGTTGFAYKAFTTIIGEDYAVTVTATNGTTPSLNAIVSSGGTTTVALTSGVTKVIYFKANSTSTTISVKPASGSGSMTYYIQDASIKQRAKYTAVAVMSSDYYPFGMQMPGRSINVGDYKYGYNGMEKDNEVKNFAGSSYTTEFRQYDPRLGRWKSLDPLMAAFPWQSPYCAFDNNPVYYTDPLGLNSEGGPGKDGKGSKLVGASAGTSSAQERAVYNPDEYGGEIPAVTIYGRKRLQITMQTKDGIPQKLNPAPPKFHNFEEEAAEEVRQRATIYMDKSNQPQITSGAPEEHKFAIQQAKTYAPVLNVLIPGWELASKLAQGEEISAGDVIIEGMSLLPGGKIFGKGGKLFYKAAANSDEAVDITNKTLKWACFIAGTKISTEDGFKNIEGIQVGDKVWAFDEVTGNKSLKIVYNTVIREIDHLDMLVIGTDIIFTTDDHPFYVNDHWVTAANLQVGDTLDLLNGEKAVLSEKSRIDTTVTVYNFAVSDYATYYVGEQQILVHNTCDFLTDAVNSVFSDPERLKHFLYGGKNSRHNWETLVTSMNADDIKNIAEDVLRTGTDAVYKSGKSKIKSVTFNGVTKTVEIPYVIKEGKMYISSGWVK